MKFFIPVLLACALTFSGCISIFESLTFHRDGTFSIGRDLGIDDMMFSMTDSFSKIFTDSTETSKPKVNLADSLKESLQIDKTKLSLIPGFISFDERDTSSDGFHHFISEIRLRDTSGLAVAKQLLYPDSSKSKKSSSNNSPLKGFSFPGPVEGTQKGFKVTLNRTANRTIVDVSFTIDDEAIEKKDKKDMKNKKHKKSAFDESAFLSSFLNKMQFGYKIYSPFLLPSSDKNISNLDGGQQWKLPLEELINLKKGKTFRHQFVITQ